MSGARTWRWQRCSPTPRLSSRTSNRIPPREVDGVPVLDLDALLQRRPRVCLADGLTYDNPAGARHPRRYQDLEEMLEAGISVLTTIGLEYIAEQQDFVRQVVGRAPVRAVPGGRGRGSGPALPNAAHGVG